MIRFIARRILWAIPLLIGVSFLTFLFIWLAPGNFLDSLKMNPQISPEAISLFEKKFNLDKPFLVQYAAWAGNLMRGNLGYSFMYRMPVARIIGSRAANTLILSVSAMAITWCFAIPLGVYAARRKGGVFDWATGIGAYIGVSVPSFLTALLLLYGATFIPGIPLGGMRSVSFDTMSIVGKVFDIARHVCIPALALALGNIFVLAKLMRANMLEVISAPFIVGAQSRGIPPQRVFFVHALKNALNPMITIFGYQISSLLSGAALTEIVTGWPGLGQITVAAVQGQDVYLVMGSVMMGAVMLVAGNVAADIALAYVDPRIQLGK